jgi:alkanesulfonate monooxygenase SsuD/methylene tetrahydromethanopterin reductase-like flavin-dependent oxidoreductase (luciferase family)
VEVHVQIQRAPEALDRAGREAAGREADPDTLRVSRSVLVTKTDAEAEDYLGDLMPGHPKLSAHPSAATSRERR